MANQRVGVIGAGTMGNGIAHVFARKRLSVILCDVEQRFLDRESRPSLRISTAKPAKGKITESTEIRDAEAH